MRLRGSDVLIMSTPDGGERKIPANKWRINRNTPVGDDADLWEYMPYNGQRYLRWADLVAVEREEAVT